MLQATQFIQSVTMSAKREETRFNQKCPPPQESLTVFHDFQPLTMLFRKSD